MLHWSRIRAVPRSCFLFQKVAGFHASRPIPWGKPHRLRPPRPFGPEPSSDTSSNVLYGICSLAGRIS